MKKIILTAVMLSCLGSIAEAAILTELPSDGDQRVPTQRVDYPVAPVEGGSVLDVDISGTFSFNLLGQIPPNETILVDVGATLGNPGQPYRVIGLGWDVQIDAIVPSWLSDASIAFGGDPTYANPDLLVAPGMGDDFPGFVQYDTGGIIDLTNVPGSGDVSFGLADGRLYLEFFEIFDDFGNGPAPDAIWEQGSHLMIQVMAVPEPTITAWLAIVVLLWARRSGPGA